MKKKILLDTLALDKETVLKLNERQLNAVEGGAGYTFHSCNAPDGVEQPELALNSCCATSCTLHTDS